jgi:carbon monoxide dehydrogenase subunit G
MFPRTNTTKSFAPPISVVRQRIIRATPEAIHELLADPTQLARVLPRVERIDVIQMEGNWARVQTTMAFGPLGTVRSEGEVRWTLSEFVFQSTTPVQIEARWLLTPVVHGTEVTAALNLDLRPMLGPLAGLVPPERVADMIGPDLDTTLETLARHFQR